MAPPRAAAAIVPWGTVLVPGAQWAGAAAANGDLNVYSNGDGNEDATGKYGLDYECVELAQRWAAIRFGEEPIWPVAFAYQMWAAGPSLPVPFQQLPNGGATPPQFGDLLVFGQSAASSTGHVAVVSGTGPGYVDVVEQNWDNTNATGTARLTMGSGNVMPPRAGLPVLGWLRAGNAPAGLQGAAGPGGYTVDGYGGVHPYGSASPVSGAPSWQGFDIARAVARRPGTTSGYVLDGWGGVHPFGGAPPVSGFAYWPGFDIARGIALRADGVSGYVLDGWGGVHPFGGAPPVSGFAYWPGWDIARGIVLRADGVSGYTLDGWGGIHPFGGAPAVATGGYWPGWDIARAVALVPGSDTSGYTLDGWGGIHPFGAAPVLPSSAYFPGQDISRGLVLTSGGGYYETAWGNIHQFGSAPPVTVSAFFSDPVARGIG